MIIEPKEEHNKDFKKNTHTNNRYIYIYYANLLRYKKLSDNHSDDCQVKTDPKLRKR